MVLRWLRSIFSSSKKLIGSDHFGNKYYETIKSSGKVQRSVESGLPHEEYTSGQVPHEWESWIRGKRVEPPTQEEIDKHLNYTLNIQRKAAIKQIEDDAKQEQAYRDGLIAREPSARNTAADEALARNPNTRSSSSAEPKHGSHASKGVAYEPDSWSPGQNQPDKNPEGQAEAWTPGGKN